MAMKVIGIAALLYGLATSGRYVKIQKREWEENPSPSLTEGDVECFTEYMELWLHRTRIEGLRLWLSGTLRIPVSLVSLENLNLKLSACGFSLLRDQERNYFFRVLYSGCFVQLEHGNFIMYLNLLRRINRYGGRSNSFVMKCPLARAPSGEHIQCDPDFIQVTRQIPTDNWNNKLPWSLALRGKLVVALEDASLIRLNIETSGPNITVQARRREILHSEMEMDKPGEFLPLQLVSGHYSYSMEAICPNVSSTVPDAAVLQVLKRRVGLVKRGGLYRENLTLSSVSVSQTDAFSVLESSDYVMLTINTTSIMKTKTCPEPGGGRLVQPFFRVDATLTFKESPHSVVWSLENFLPCIEPSVGNASTTNQPPATPSADPTTAVQPSSLPSFGPEWQNTAKSQRAILSSISTSELPPSAMAMSERTLGSLNFVTLSSDRKSAGTSSVNAQLTPSPTAYTGTFLSGVPKLSSKYALSNGALFLVGAPLAILSPPGTNLRERSADTTLASIWGSEVMENTGTMPTETVGSVPSQRTVVSEAEETEGCSSGNPLENTVMKGERVANVLHPQREPFSPYDLTAGSVPRLDNSTDEDWFPNNGSGNTTFSSLHETEAEGTASPKADHLIPSMASSPVPSLSGDYMPPMASIYAMSTDQGQQAMVAEPSMMSLSAEPLPAELKSSGAHWANVSESSLGLRRASTDPTPDATVQMTSSSQEVHSTGLQGNTTSLANPAHSSLGQAKV